MDFRVDRLATLYLVSPLMPLAGVGRPSIPILMYHSISDEAEPEMHPYFRTSTSPSALAAQLEHLHKSGYQTRSLPQAVAQLKLDSGNSAKSVVITFDDGYSDFREKAFPLLNQFGFGATVFLPTAYIGDGPLKFNGRNCLTWSEVRELQRYGISFGSHTVTHPQLSRLNKNALETEIVDSKNIIEEKTGCGVDSFAYPYAFPQTNREFKGMLRESLSSAGYVNGVCTMVGKAGSRSESLFLERLPVNSCDDLAFFQAKLAGAYDWIGSLQSASKALHAWF